MSKAIIELSNIQKSYTVDNSKVNVLNNINLEIHKGDFVGIYGKSGSGKSTLLNIIGLIDKMNSGIYLLNGIDISKISSKQENGIRNREIGYIFQSFNLINSLNVLENVAMPLGYSGVGKKERILRAKELLESVGLKDKAYSYPHKLSGGEKQRVSISRALSNNPSIILADEPTGALDSKNSEIIMNLLKKINDSGTTGIMVTHDETLTKYMTRLFYIKDGNIDCNTALKNLIYI